MVVHGAGINEITIPWLHQLKKVAGDEEQEFADLDLAPSNIYLLINTMGHPSEYILPSPTLKMFHNVTISHDIYLSSQVTIFQSWKMYLVFNSYWLWSCMFNFSLVLLFTRFGFFKMVSTNITTQ